MKDDFLVTLTLAGRDVYDGQRSIAVKAYQWEVTENGELVFDAIMGAKHKQAYAKGQWAHVCYDD